MRIIGGKFKGHPIPVSKQFNGRPTTDFAREGLMNALGHLIEWESTQVHDLFTGTGAMALECLSRGAQHVVACDIQVAHVRHLQILGKQWDLKNLHVLKVDCWSWLDSVTTLGDLVFADPPFDYIHLEKLPDKIIPKLHENAWFILEHPKEYSFASHDHFEREKKYGHVHFSFFKNKKQ
jgi:16S rRNA (guanine966-N2)-methyltransferase